MIIIDGKQISAEIVAELKQLPKPNKTLAAVFVGASEASESFLRQKSKLAAELGVDFTICRFSEDVSEDELKDEIKKIGDDEKTGGMIIQLPLPSKFNRENILSALNPKKDVDGLRARDLNQDQIEKLALSDKTKPLAVRTAETILDKIGFDIKDKIVAVVGRGLLVGKPIIQWLKGKCRELIVVDSKGDITRIRKADLVITGVGKAGLIKPEDRLSAADLEKMETSIKSETDFPKFDFWIEADQQILRKISLNFGVKESFLRGVSVTFTDYNKPLSIEAPEGAKSIEEIFDFTFGANVPMIQPPTTPGVIPPPLPFGN